MKFARWGLAGLLIPTLVGAQVNTRSVLLDWGTVRVLLAPDSARGSLLWADRPGDPSDTADDACFISYLNRDATEAWIRESREFLAQVPSESDTSAFRASTMLITNRGEVFILHRRENGKWSSQRFIAFQSEGKVLLAVATSESGVLEFLRTLERVLQDTPPHAGAVADSITIDGALSGATRVKQKRGTGHPRYPDPERSAWISGSVWVSFVVLPNGKADLTSYQAHFAETVGFEQAVRESLKSMRFDPATRDGRPIATRVYQPFTFSIVR